MLFKKGGQRYIVRMRETKFRQAEENLKAILVTPYTHEKSITKGKE